MYFKKYIHTIKRIMFLFIAVIFTTSIHAKEANKTKPKKDTQKQKITEKKVKKKVDNFIPNILLQDTSNILDSSLPLPYFSLPYTQTHNYLNRRNSPKDSLFDEAMKPIVPIITTYDYSQLKNMDTTQDEHFIDFRIHELEKEAYMLRSQLIEKEKKKRNWLINTQASGYYIGIGVMLGFMHDEQTFGIEASKASAGGIVKLGYLRYLYNHLGLKAELFNIYGNHFHNNELVLYNYYGLRFVVLHDIPVFFKQHYFGFFAGFGVGSYFFSKKYQSIETYNYLTNAHNMGLNLNIGVSWTYAKHHRIEIEHILISPLTTLSNGITNIFEPSYIVSYSWVF